MHLLDSPNPAGPAGPAAASSSPAPDLLSLWDWRRRVADLYGTIRLTEPLRAWTSWRQTRDALFRDHAQSPLEGAARREFAGLPVGPYDPSLRFMVDVLPPRDAAPFTVDCGHDGEIVLTPAARTDGLVEALGSELTLFWTGGYGGGIFLPFRDATSGSGSYGGGRYLLDTVKGADLGRARDGRVVLDFNFAYNPSCAYSDRWVCPLSPPDNTLAVPIRGGELTPRLRP